MSELDEKYKAFVEEAVEQTLLRLGLNTSTSEDILELQRDFQHLRAWRKTTKNIERQSLLLVLGSLITGFLAAAWLGIKSLILKE